MKKVSYVTGNNKKLEEVRSIFGNDFRQKLVSVKLDLPEYQGEPEFIAREKCKLASERVMGPVFIEDSSLCFNALCGLPGPYIKCFLTKLGNRGLYDLLSSYTDKSAVAKCLIAFSRGPNDEIVVIEGNVRGTIVEPRGSGDFGWDRIFIPDGYNQTFAEMPKKLKNKISHRTLAIQKLKLHLLQNL